MKAVRFSATEVEAIRAWADGELGHTQTLDVSMTTARSILKKLLAAEQGLPGVNVKPLEDALVAAANGKVVRLEGGFAMASRMAANVGATVPDAAMLGAWMFRQGWLTGPMTLLDCLKKWYMWLPKAKATEPPPALSPGLGSNGHDGRGPSTPGSAAAGGRRAPGFR